MEESLPDYSDKIANLNNINVGCNELKSGSSMYAESYQLFVDAFHTLALDIQNLIKKETLKAHEKNLNDILKEKLSFLDENCTKLDGFQENEE